VHRELREVGIECGQIRRRQPNIKCSEVLAQVGDEHGATSAIRRCFSMNRWASCHRRQATHSSIDRLAERERERFNSRIEKLDLKHAFVDGSWLPNELIETLLGHRAVASVIDVCASSYTCGLSIDEHPETHGRPSRGWSENEVQITRVKPVRDPAAGNFRTAASALTVHSQLRAH